VAGGVESIDDAIAIGVVTDGVRLPVSIRVDGDALFDSIVVDIPAVRDAVHVLVDGLSEMIGDGIAVRIELGLIITRVALDGAVASQREREAGAKESKKRIFHVGSWAPRHAAK